MNTKVKKWIGIISSFLISTYVMFVISLPILLLGLLMSKSYANEHEYFTANLVGIVALLFPLIVLGYFVFKILHKDILKLVSEELDDSGEPVLLNPQEKQEDEINQKIVNAFNKAKEKLGISKDVKLIRMVNSPYVNAFAISNTKGEAAVTVFDGLAKNADEEMMQAIIGHELGHIKNKDSVTNITLYANQYAIPVLAQISDKISYYALDIAKEIPFVNYMAYAFYATYKFGSMVAMVPGSWTTHLINLWVSRESEHLADKAGVEASSKEAMLKTLNFLSSIEGEKPKKGSLLEFLASTHPPIDKRKEYINKI
jgi:heat shock protein HtpX